MLVNTSSKRTEPIIARPFVKWVGGKGAILDKIKEHLPDTIKHYYELFVGGGALFFNIANRVERAFIADVNRDLITTYEVIQRDVDKLISRLKQHQEKHNKDYYYKVREQHELKDPIEIAARFIYLNKTCYNGLYRVNSQDRFNVPIGSYSNLTICNVSNLKKAHKVLQEVSIIPSSFDSIEVEKESVVYCDPPYHKNYNQYTYNQFSEQNQRTLRETALSWLRRGCKVIISNNDTELIRTLYANKKFAIYKIQAPRVISCKNESRGNVSELLIVGT